MQCTTSRRERERKQKLVDLLGEEYMELINRLGEEYDEVEVCISVVLEQRGTVTSSTVTMAEDADVQLQVLTSILNSFRRANGWDAAETAAFCSAALEESNRTAGRGKNVDVEIEKG